MLKNEVKIAKSYLLQFHLQFQRQCYPLRFALLSSSHKGIMDSFIDALEICRKKENSR